MQQLKALAVEFCAKSHDPSDITSWSRQAVGEPGLHEVHSGNHDDRYRAGQSMHRQSVDNASGDDDIRVCRDQLGGGSLALLRVLAGHPALDDEIASLDPAEPPHGLIEPGTRKRLSPSDNESDAGALWRLLRSSAPAGGRTRCAEQYISPSCMSRKERCDV